MRRRPEKGLLGGMVEIPSTPWRAAPWTLADAAGEAPIAAEWSPLPGTVRHGFTHFQLELAVAAGHADLDAAGLWSPLDRLGEHALPTLMKKIAHHAISMPSRRRHESAAKSGNSSPNAKRTGANERR